MSVLSSLRAVLLGGFLCAALIGAAPSDPSSSNADAVAAYNHGVDASIAGHYADAIGDYTRAIALDPSFAAAYRNRGDAHLALCDATHAIADYDASLRIRDDAGARNNRGLAYMAERAYGPAMADFTQAIALERSAAPLVNRGLLLAHQKRYAAAEADYDAAIAIDGSDPVAYADRAGLFVLENRLPRALQDGSSALQWDEAIGADGRRLHPLDARAYRRLADVYAKLGMPSLAASNRAAAAKLTKASGMPECPTGL